MAEKKYRLIGGDGKEYLSEVKGEYGGHSGTIVYGRMDCSAARTALNGPHRDIYISHRVFFKDEATALKAGYRPCGRCLKEKYDRYKADPDGYRKSVIGDD